MLQKYYPRDFFDPYDDDQLARKKKHDDRKQERYDDVVIGKGPFYRPGYNSVSAVMKPENTRDMENEINDGYYWDNTVGEEERWEKMAREKLEMPRGGDAWVRNLWEPSEESEVS